jgi:hypothetical protein
MLNLLTRATRRLLQPSNAQLDRRLRELTVHYRLQRPSQAGLRITASHTEAGPSAAPATASTSPRPPGSPPSGQTATGNGLVAPSSECVHYLELWQDPSARDWPASARLRCRRCDASRSYALIPAPAAAPTSSTSARPETLSSAAYPAPAGSELKS